MNNLNENEHDITKKMIDVMRNGSTKKHITEETDITRRMLETIRNGKRLITEVDEVQPGGGNGYSQMDATQSTGQPSTSSQGEDLDGESLDNEKKAFMDAVSPKVEFEDFKIYRNERNVVFSGKFQDLGGLEFMMSLKDADGLAITVQGLKINADTITILNHLYGYYKNWSDAWATKLNTEYKAKPNEQNG